MVCTKRHSAMLALFLGILSCSAGKEGADATLAPDVQETAGEELHYQWETVPQELPSGDFGPGVDVSGPPDCPAGAGCFLDECVENSQCMSGWCVEHHGKGVCTTTCMEECPAGWKCTETNWALPDMLFVCLSDAASLCKPCNSSGDCGIQGAAEELCLVFGADGSFCGAGCNADSDCPGGFHCEKMSSTEGLEQNQCVPQDGQCLCTAKSAADGSWTTCFVENEWGRCEGARSCTAEGLTDCNAKTPQSETCNGEDDDCDGGTDEGTCDDGNLCTDDSCDQGSCVHANNNVTCDDDNACTVDDKCVAGQCLGTLADCDCLKDEDCGALEDGNPCTGTLKCDLDGFPFQCVTVPDTPIICDPPSGVHGPCLTAVCNSASGQCEEVPGNEGGACDDGDACTVTDACATGLCSGSGLPNCNDGNPCTDDSCIPETGCHHVDNNELCQDGDVCTIDDVCQGAECVGQGQLDCDDDNPCTDDSCDPETGCVHAPNEDLCDDEDPCTLGDVCQATVCVGALELSCDDDNPCTDDECQKGQGCQFWPNSAFCNDQNPCTIGDFCSQTQCLAGAPLDCDDSNVCTDDSCQQALNGEPECKHDFNTAPCGGGKLCVEGVCSCIPDCDGKLCGPDGCGGSCISVPELCAQQSGVCLGAQKNDSLCVNGQYAECDSAIYYWHNTAYQVVESSCDLLDNDCDGAIDEELGSTTCGLGLCEHTVQNCENGKLQICDPLAGKSDEVCDGADNDCNGVTDENFGTSTCGIGQCLHTVQNCHEGVLKPCDPMEGTQEEILDGVDNNCNGEVDEGFPVPGALIITELMANPDCVGDDFGEWVEVHNAGSVAWDLNGWVLRDNDSDKITIEAGGPLVIGPGEYKVLGTNADTNSNGGISVDYAYNVNKFQLANGAAGDEAMLVGPGGVVVDEVWWASGMGFPDFSGNKGRSIALHKFAFSHSANDDGNNWFASTAPIEGGCGDKGSPGVPNEP